MRLERAAPVRFRFTSPFEALLITFDITMPIAKVTAMGRQKDTSD